MSNMYADVGEFHRKFGIPAYDPRKPCDFPTKEIIDYRIKFLEEELIELKKALAEDNLPDAIDALADIAYVALGTAHYFNVPFHQVWEEVQRSNMARVQVTRENCPPDKQYRVDMVMKPPDWIPPQIAGIIDNHNVFARRIMRRHR